MNLMEVDLPNEIKVETDLNTDSSLRDFDEKPFQHAYYDSENVNNKVDDQVEVQSSFGGVEYVYDLHTGEHFFKPEFVVPEDLNMKVESQEMGQPYTEELLNGLLKTYVKSEPTTSESEAGKPLSHLQNSKFNGGKIKEESFAETEFLTQQEVNIKSKDEESDQSDTRPAKHKMSFKCPHCPYQTCYSFNLKKHQLAHASKEEVELHKCPDCPFATKWKNSLTIHLRVHKNLHEVTWYQCPECPYETKHKANLTRQHMLIHKKNVPVDTLCSFKSPRKPRLQKHLKYVQRPKYAETIYSAEEARNIKESEKCNFKAHKLGKRFSCSLCPYTTHRKHHLENHILRHRNGNEVQWFQCSHCLFQSKHKYALRRHLLKHKDPDSKTWFKCIQCPFKTTQKSYLKQHNYTHMSADEIQEWFRCPTCPYKSLQKCSLKQHQLVHKKPEEIANWYYCYFCMWRTYVKANLARHIKTIHRAAEDRFVDRGINGFASV